LYHDPCSKIFLPEKMTKKHCIASCSTTDSSTIAQFERKNIKLRGQVRGLARLEVKKHMALIAKSIAATEEFSAGSTMMLRRPSYLVRHTRISSVGGNHTMEQSRIMLHTMKLYMAGGRRIQNGKINEKDNSWTNITGVMKSRITS
jgi:hypothetical protein